MIGADWNHGLDGRENKSRKGKFAVSDWLGLFPEKEVDIQAIQVLTGSSNAAAQLQPALIIRKLWTRVRSNVQDSRLLSSIINKYDKGAIVKFGCGFQVNVSFSSGSIMIFNNIC